MSEERRPRRGHSRRSEETPDGLGGAAGSVPGLPRQADAATPRPGPGGGRRRAAAAEFGPTELAAALRQSVSPVGAAGPPRAGLARIRRRARTRQRRRTVAAGSAGVLLLAMAVSAAAGDSFDIVPVLTGVVGLGHSDTSSSGSGGAPEETGQVRTVRPPADAAGKKGPAIGPVAPASVSTALAAAGIPACTPADLTTVTTVDSVNGGVSYGHVEAVAQLGCAVAGPPVLQVENAAGTAASSVVILQHVATDGSALPGVPTWGTVLKLQPGQGYDFQFAWAPDACGGTGVGGSAGSAAVSGSGGGGPTASAQVSSAAAYTLSYLIENNTPTEPVDLTAACGATVYVTDIYPAGAYPLPKPQGSPSPQSSASAPATTPSPAPPSPSTAPPATTPVTTAPSSSADSSAPGGASGTSPSPGSSPQAGSAPSQPTSP